MKNTFFTSKGDYYERNILLWRFQYLWIDTGNEKPLRQRYKMDRADRTAVIWKGCRIIEEGLCGRTTVFEDELREGRKGAAFLPTLLESHAPVDRVVLMLGTNDCKTFYNASAEVIGLGVERLVEQIRKADKNIRILLISPIQLGEGVWEQGYDPEFNEKSVEVSKGLKAVYQKVADKYGCDFLAASDVAEPSKEDREHLNEEGHKKLAEAVLEVLAA